MVCSGGRGAGEFERSVRLLSGVFSKMTGYPGPNPRQKQGLGIQVEGSPG